MTRVPGTIVCRLFIQIQTEPHGMVQVVKVISHLKVNLMNSKKLVLKKNKHISFTNLKK